MQASTLRVRSRYQPILPFSIGEGVWVLHVRMSVSWSRRVVFLGCHGVGESYFSAPLHTNTHGKLGIVFPCEHDVIGKWAEFSFSEQKGSILHVVQPTKCSIACCACPEKKYKYAALPTFMIATFVFWREEPGDEAKERVIKVKDVYTSTAGNTLQLLK